MGNVKNNEPTSFEDMEEVQVPNPTYEKPGTDPGVQDLGKPVETTEVTE